MRASEVRNIDSQFVGFAAFSSRYIPRPGKSQSWLQVSCVQDGKSASKTRAINSKFTAQIRFGRSGQWNWVLCGWNWNIIEWGIRLGGGEIMIVSAQLWRAPHPLYDDEFVEANSGFFKCAIFHSRNICLAGTRGCLVLPGKSWLQYYFAVK